MDRGEAFDCLEFAEGVPSGREIEQLEPPVVPPPTGFPPFPASATGTSASASTRNAALQAMRTAGVFLVTMEKPPVRA